MNGSNTRSLEASLPVQWAEATDCKGEVFYHDKATGFATYTHPNDAKYHEVVYVLYISIYMYCIYMYVYVYGLRDVHASQRRQVSRGRC